MNDEILLLAYDRPHYLKQVVAGIQAMRVPAGWNVVSSVDVGEWFPVPEVVSLVRRVSSDVSVQPQHRGCNQHVRLALTAAFDRGVDHLLYLEDDIVPSPDCLEFCMDHMAMLDSMPRIKGMQLLGENHGDVHVAWRNRHGFKAHRWFNAWGNFWSRRGLGEILNEWSSSWDDNPAPWDNLLCGRFLDREWLTLTPLLSRVRNIGETGCFMKRPEDYTRCARDFWAGSDFSRPIASDFR